MPSVRVRKTSPLSRTPPLQAHDRKNGLLTELRAREFYKSRHRTGKRKKAAAIKRHYKRLRSQQLRPSFIDRRFPDRAPMAGPNEGESIALLISRLR